MTYASTILATAGLQSYWRLGENAGAASVADSKGAVSGTPSNVTLGVTGLIGGDPDTAASFNGTTSGINLGNNYSFTGTASFSVEVWMRLNDVTSQQHPVDKSWNNGANREGWGISVASGGIVLQRWQANALVATASATVSIGTIYYIVGTYDGTNSRLYVNAGPQNISATDTNSIPVTVSSANLGIGGFNGGTFYFTNGVLDEVAIYNVVLSTSTISSHFAAANYGTYVPPAPFPGIANLDARRMF